MAIVVTYRTAGSGRWLCPSGLTSIDLVETWGGGTPGTTGTATTGGNGGAGGEYSAETDVAVTPGRLYAWNAASAGGQAIPGGNSSFAADVLTILAHGATQATFSAPGKGGRGSLNSVHHNGGDGGSDAGHAFGGGGGSSAGTLLAGSPGGSATSSGGGAGGLAPAGGGNGGLGGSSGSGQVPAQPGHTPGGGGGGGGLGLAAPGGAGQPGMVQLTYTGAFQPQVPFFPAGYAPLPSDWDGWIQAPLSFLTSKIVFRAELTSALSLPAATTTLIPFNSILEDPLSGWESGASQWLCPPGYTGLYVVSVTASCAANASAPELGAIAGVDSLAQQYSVDRAWVPTARPGIASGEIPVRLYGGQDGVSGYARLVGAPGSAVTTAGQRCAMQVTWFST